MQVEVTGRHIDVTPAIKEYVLDRCEHDLHEFPRIESVHVILDVEKYRQFAEVVITGSNHIRVDAKDESDDLYASINRAFERAAKQMRKLRDKVQDHKGPSQHEIELRAQASGAQVELD